MIFVWESIKIHHLSIFKNEVAKLQTARYPTPISPLPTKPQLKSREIGRFPTASMSKKLLQPPKDAFKPCYMFFYGELMDPEILEAVLDLPETPALARGEIRGFKMKMWGIYPTLISSNRGGEVSGMVWRVESEEQFLSLKKHEMDDYTWCFCDVKLENGRVLRRCRTFCWARDPNSEELEDGLFDLEYYQKHHKTSRW
jgi:hypothetical protein